MVIDRPPYPLITWRNGKALPLHLLRNENSTPFLPHLPYAHAKPPALDLFCTFLALPLLM